MARILAGDVWYEELAESALYEADYERLVIRHAPSVFPGWIAVPFKCKVVGGDNEPAKPDLALISHNYGDWWVVEVELSHHSLTGHVVPQVRRLSTAEYGEEVARALCKASRGLRLKKVGNMLKGRPPRVLVV